MNPARRRSVHDAVTYHALRFGRAKARELQVMDQVETVRGLDEFDPKHCAWETRLFRARQASEAHKDRLLRAAYMLATGKRFGR